MNPRPEQWVFLRGLARHSTHWHSFTEVFARELEGREVEHYDLAGNGSQSHRSSFWNLREALEDIREQRKTNFLARSIENPSENQKASKEQTPVHLLTISMGSMLGALWAELYPEEIASLTLINTSDRRHGFFFERLQPGSWLPLTRAIFATRPTAREEEILRITTHRLMSLQESAEKFSHHPPPKLRNFVRQLFSASQFSFSQEPPPVPVRILVGLQDRLVSPSCSLRLARSWGITPQVHPEAGHDLPLEAPEWVVAQLKNPIEIRPTVAPYHSGQLLRR